MCLKVTSRILFFLCGLLFYHLGFSQGFSVDKIDVEIYINEKGYFDVVEKYDVEFQEYKHGIFRDIQTKYDLLTAEGEPEKRKIKISKIKVPNHKFSVPPSFLQQFEDELQIKIGDKDKTVIGPQHYEVRYRVHDAFLFEELKTHFYWNVKTGNWLAPFYAVNFKIYPPQGVELSLEDFFVYSGRAGITLESEEFDIEYKNGAFIGNSKEGFQSKHHENVTVLLKLPAGSIKEAKPYWLFWDKYGWLFIIVGLISAFYWIWRKYAKGHKVIANISYFPPDNISPSMAGFLIDDKADTQDLIALIPHWGAQGFIQLEHIPKKGIFSKEDTKVIKLQDLPEDAPGYEKIIFNGLFSNSGKAERSILGSIFGIKKETPSSEVSVLISSLKDTFYTTMSSAKNQLKAEGQVYYEAKTRKVKRVTFAGIILIGLLFIVLVLFTWGIIGAAAVGLTSFFLLILTPILRKKTRKGNELLSDLKGFKQFIKIAEENKLKMLLKEDPNYFEITMAYALAFGSFKKWSKKFEGLDVEPPSWYSSPVGVMSMNHFSNTFSRSISEAQKTMVSSPSSRSSNSGRSGGGSSGGGFGGGGGGSW